MIILWDSSGEPRWPAGLINRPVRFDSGPASKFGGEQRRSTRAGLSSAGGPERATTDSFAELAQQVDAAGLNPARYRFESGARHQFARAVKGHWPAGPFSGRQLTNFALLPASGFPERARAIIISGSRAVRSTRGRGSHPRKAGHLALPARAWGQRDRAARDTSSPLDSQPQRMARRGYRIRGGVNIRRGRNPRLASGYDRTVILGQRHPLQLGICTQPSVFQAKPMRPATTDPLADQADGTGRRSPRTGSAAAIPSESRGNPVSRLSAPVVCAQTRMWQPKGTGRGSGWEPRAHNLPWTRP